MLLVGVISAAGGATPMSLSAFPVFSMCGCFHLSLLYSTNFLCSLPRADKLTKNKGRQGNEYIILLEEKKTLSTTSLPGIQDKVLTVKKTY